MDLSREALLNKLQEGSSLLKFNPDGSVSECFFYISPKLNVLCYNSSKKILDVCSNELVHLKDCEVRAGLKSDTWIKMLRMGKIREQQEDLTFSIIHSRGRKSFDLLAEDNETRNIWIKGLEILIRSTVGTRYRKITDSWLMDLFDAADRNRNGLLCKREVHELLSTLNVRLTSDEFEQYFDKTDLQAAKRRGQLRCDEFIKFYKLLTYRPELMHIIHTYSESCDFCICKTSSTIATICLGGYGLRSTTLSTSNYMTIEELKEFLWNEQKQTLSLTEVEDLVKRFDQSTEGKECSEMGVDGLREMLLSNENLLMKPEHYATVYQDMTQPLTHYWINTSHNTYLSATQLVGECTGESYVQALKRGCRSVELDIHDGPDGLPVVRHAFTLIKDALLSEILIQIKEFAFHKSSYPLFLNLENHCSISQQTIMAQLFTSTFGAMIYTADEASKQTNWPSPEQLKLRIILRGRATMKNEVSVDYGNEDENVEHEIPQNVCHELSSLIACQNTTFKGFLVAKNYKHNQSSSWSENKASSLVETHPIDWIRHNQRSISRIYPAGYRQDSSNVDPISFWNCGIQMVALNFQTGDLSMSLNHGRFSDNGQCGYILKPSILRDENSNFNPYSSFWAYLLTQRPPSKLELCIISGQHLPKRNERDTTPVSPFVKVKIFGVRRDQIEERTPVVAGNGLNPIWNHPIQFSICFPELSIVRFSVRDSDKSNTELGQYSIPFLSMQQGYRHVRLLDGHNTPTKATIFIHVRIDNMEK